MSDTVISVQNVSKAYRIWESPAARLTAPMLEGAAGLLPGEAGQWLRNRAAKNYRDFWALNGITFEVKKGESIGIIGRNGSGKSTLLQIIAGTMQPTGGSVKVLGRVAALLELGSGFNPEFTGRENVYLNATVLGLSRAEINERFDSIAAFADIGDFIDQPVKTYSSGMLVRLAFAVQTSIEPEIFIVDEALSVGDFFFQQKCFKRIAALRAQGTTLLFVSHDMGSVRDLCQRAIYLRQGQMIFWGDSQPAVAKYLREAETVTNPAPPVQASLSSPQDALDRLLAGAFWCPAPDESPDASVAAHLLAIELLNENRQSSSKFRMGSKAIFRVYFRSQTAAEVHVSMEIKNRHGQVVSSLGTRLHGLEPAQAQSGQVWCCTFEVQLGLEAGQYSFQICLGHPYPRPNIGIRFLDSPWLGPIMIDWDYANETAPFLGMFDLPAAVTLSPYQPT